MRLPNIMHGESASGRVRFISLQNDSSRHLFESVIGRWAGMGPTTFTKACMHTVRNWDRSNK